MNCHATINARITGRGHGGRGQHVGGWTGRVIAGAASAIAATAACAVFSTSAAAAQAGCPSAVEADVAQGWTRYRQNDLSAATLSFNSALKKCPRNDGGASTGLAYVELRQGSLASAKRRLNSVIARDSSNVDALVGRGIAAWRDGDVRLVSKLFQRVKRIDPSNAEAADYLARIPAPQTNIARTPQLLPDTTVYPARIEGDRFEVRTGGAWSPFYVKGMNLGAALPGKYASEFPDSAVYAQWIAQMGAMGVNAIRIYTIHPPQFYQALEQYNVAHKNTPLWLVHGVWTELPPKGDFDNTQWKSEFFQEMRRAVDALHGVADLSPRPGHASGHYTADTSPWVLAYIIGREWEPYAVLQFNAKSKRTSWHGTYLDMAKGTAADAWMAEASENIVAYEMKTYRAQRPVAYTNWPTLDPLAHATETTVKQELAIRKARGEVIAEIPNEYDNDRSKLDANLIHATQALPAGWFASYHAYPYYPDFMLYDTSYINARSSEGRSNYFGYLQALKRHHSMAVLISEYGVPASIGIAHFQPQGWNHGGMTEHEMAAIDARLTREIAESGMAGGMLFAWIDEWFKKNWIAIDHEIPLDRTRMWHNRMDAEQHYGMIAMDATPAVAGSTIAERSKSWHNIAPLYDDGSTLRVTSDASYLWLYYHPAASEAVGASSAVSPGNSADVMIGFDVIDPVRGDKRWPNKAGAALPVGLELVLLIHGDTAQLVADQAANPWRIRGIPVKGTAGRETKMQATTLNPVYHAERAEMHLNHSVGSAANADGVYTPLVVMPNRRRFTSDSSEIQALAYDRGLLRQGNAPDGLWERDSNGDIEVRIPWMLLNVTDPSERRVLDNLGRKAIPSELATTIVSGIRIVVRATDSRGGVRALPSSNALDAVQTYTWPTWQQPQWTSRLRSAYEVMRATFETLKASGGR